jgi:hypothetical protein
MERWLLRIFRLVIVTGVLGWVVATSDLAAQASAFVDDTLWSWSQSFER